MDFSQRSSLFVLELINTAVSTWTVVLDTRHPLAVARTLGATPGQTGLGLAMAQLLPALPGAAGIPFAWRSRVQYPPGPWLLAPGLGILLTSLFSRPSPHSPSHDDQSRKHSGQPRSDSRSNKNHPRCQLTRRRPARKWSSARTSRRRQGARRPDVVLEEVGAGQLMPHRGTCSRRFRSERVSALPMSARISTCEHAQDRHRQVNPDQRIGRLIISHIRCAPAKNSSAHGRWSPPRNDIAKTGLPHTTACVARFPRRHCPREWLTRDVGMTYQMSSRNTPTAISLVVIPGAGIPSLYSSTKGATSSHRPRIGGTENHHEAARGSTRGAEPIAISAIPTSTSFQCPSNPPPVYS